jgi:hypothetical protein
MAGGSEVCRVRDVIDNWMEFGDVSAVYDAFSSYWNMDSDGRATTRDDSA